MKKKAAQPPFPARDDSTLFRAAVSDAIPLPAPDRVSYAAPATPGRPLHSAPDKDDTFADSLSDVPPGWDEALEPGEELSFLRDGLSRQTLKKLRRGRWPVEAQIDLHGMNRDEAREALGRFLAGVMSRGSRCVRIIHGKGLGSKNREPVLRTRVRIWLARSDEVLAYCQAPDTQGGAGAMLVLLRA